MEGRVVSLPVRALWLTVAGTSLALAALGVVLPVLPVTPFVLAAAYAAAKGSPRLHDWILRHRIFGQVVRDWQAGGAVARRTKLVAVATMLASGAILVLIAPPLVAGAAAVMMAIVGSWLWRRPEPPAVTSGERQPF